MIEAVRVAVLLLAAGASRRFGNEDKLLTGLAGKPLALHAAGSIDALSPGRRIAICASEALAEPLRELGFEIVWNAEPDKGQSHSIALGVEAAGDAEAILICLADMPFVSPAHLQRLLDEFDQDSAAVVASTAGGAAMPPALFGKRHFSALRLLEGDRGARALLAGARLVLADACELADIDRPRDLPTA